MNILKYIKYPPEIILLIDRKTKILHLLPDKIYLKLRYRIKMHKRLNLKNPQTFNEKLQWLKLHDRNPDYTKMVDKYEVKKYVADIIGEEYIIPTLGIYDKFEDIDFNKLPKQFVIKCTHDSGGMVICKDKEKLDIANAKKKIEKSLKINYFYQGREWPYKNVNRKIIIEKYMGDDLIDYRFYCFNGDVKYIYQYINESQPDNSKPEPANCNIYDIDWHLQEFHQASKPTVEKKFAPKTLDKMIKFSRIISKSIPFLRVDFYEIDGRIYFGELTFYPGGGFSKFYPDKWDYTLGDYIILNKKMKNRRLI